MHFFKKLPCAYPKLGDSVEERKGKEQKHNQPLSADGRRRFVVGPGSFLGRVDVFNFFFFFFALASVPGGQPVSSSGCLFWTVTFVPLLNGDWLHGQGKMPCH